MMTMKEIHGQKAASDVGNYGGIDSFRLAAAFLVVAIHTGPFTCWSKPADYLFSCCLGRIAVPFFLMTTGYFVLAPCVFSGFRQKARLRRFLRKSLLLYLAASLCYLPVSIYAGNFPSGAGEFLKNIFFDGTFYHLWYFPAVAAGSVLLLLLLRKSIKGAVIYCGAAYIVGLLGDSYYGLAEKIPALKTVYEGIFTVSSYTRNGIFYAPLFLFMGVAAAVPEFRCSKICCRAGAAISLLLMLIEGLLTYYLGIQRHNSMYLFLVPFLYFFYQILLESKQKAPGWLRNGSMLVYLIHPMALILLRGLAKAAGLAWLLVENTLIQYLTVCLLSLSGAWILQIFWEKRKIVCMKKEGHGLN